MSDYRSQPVIFQTCPALFAKPLKSLLRFCRNRRTHTHTHWHI